MVGVKGLYKYETMFAYPNLPSYQGQCGLTLSVSIAASTYISSVSFLSNLFNVPNINSFALGARSVNPKATVQVIFHDIERHDWATGGVLWSDKAPAPPAP
jgi:hypothetical protein